MESKEFNEILAQAREVGKILGAMIEGIGDSEPELEKVLRHRVLLAVGVAAGAGALTGWWLSSRRRPQLPPPPKVHPLDYLENYLPVNVEKIREHLPDVSIDEAAGMARSWADNVLEPKLRQGLENVSYGIDQTNLRPFLKRARQRFQQQNGKGPEDSGNA